MKFAAIVMGCLKLVPLPAFVLMAQATATLALEPPAPAFDWKEYARRPLSAPTAEADSRGVDAPTRRISSTGYTHFSTISRTNDGSMHLFSYLGQQHQGGKESAIAYRVSKDRGVTWSSPRKILDGFQHNVDWRIGATGVSATGRIIVTAVKADLASGRGQLGSIHSDDFGRTWSDFAPLLQIPPSPFEGGRSQMLTNSQIKTTPSGKLVMMSYIGKFNFTMVSDDNGASWKRSIIVESEAPNYSEMAVQPIDDQNWVVVSRIDNAKSAMAQFATRNGGQTWVLLGGLNMQVKGGYVAPTLNLVRTGGRPELVLGLTDRSTGQSILRTGDAERALSNSMVWSGPASFASGLIVRSGYQTAVIDDQCDRLVIANHREISEFDTALDISLLPLSRLVHGLTARTRGDACPAF